MTVDANRVWSATLTLTGNGDATGAQRLKFDVFGNWAENYGDNRDGIADKGSNKGYPGQRGGHLPHHPERERSALHGHPPHQQPGTGRRPLSQNPQRQGGRERGVRRLRFQR